MLLPAKSKSMPPSSQGEGSAFTMLTYVVGNLFESPAQTLVNTVNTVGVMGKGIAKEFKSIFPQMFNQYQEFCERGLLDVGQLWLWRSNHKWVLNFPTKKHWRQPSRVEYIEAGLKKFVDTYADRGITSIAFPMLGCGNGELEWEKDVRPLMERYLKNLLIDVYVYLYQRDGFMPEHRNPVEIKNWLRQEPRSLPFSEFMDDLQQLIGKELMVPYGDQTLSYYLFLDANVEVGLKIAGRDWAAFVENRQLFDVWQHIRVSGFFTEDAVPPGLTHLTNGLLALLGQLHYFKPVLVSRNYSALTKNAFGLQLTAPSDVSTDRRKLLVPQVDTRNEHNPKEA